MGWNSSGNADEEGMIWDLRQIYAKDLVGETLKAIRFARITENYSLWYHLLKRDLLTEIYQKLSKEEETELLNLIEKTKQVISNNSQAYLKKSGNPTEHEAIEDALCRLEQRMRQIMDKEHKMFGAMDSYDEDEI